MPLTNTQYDSIMRIYDDIRTNNRHIQSDRYNEVITACPAIADIDYDIIDMSVLTAKIPGMSTEKDVHALTRKLLILYIRTLISRT